MNRAMEEFYAVRDALKQDRKLFRLASLVGTDAKNPEQNLADYVAGMVMLRREGLRIEEENSRTRQVVLKAVTYTLSELKSIEYPPSGKEYHFKDGTWNNNLLGTAGAVVEELEAILKRSQEKDSSVQS